jgi:hypothetical protein
MATQAEQIKELEERVKLLDEEKTNLLSEIEALKSQNKILIKQKNDALGIFTPKELTETEKIQVEEVKLKLHHFEKNENVIMGMPSQYGELAREYKELTGENYQRQFNKYN